MSESFFRVSIAAVAGHPTYELKTELETAIAGVPVVVTLVVRNNSNAELKCPFFNHFRQPAWEWSSTEGGSFVVGEQELHWETMPSRKLWPSPVVLKPGESRARRFAVMTPSKFGEKVTWTLCADPLLRTRVSDDFEPPCVEICGRDVPPRCLLDKIDGTVVQAAMLPGPRQGVLNGLVEQRKWGIIDACEQKRDRIAALLQFSRFLSHHHGVATAWEGFEQDPPEIRCLRNFLLLDAFRHGLPDDLPVLTTREQISILRMIDDEDCFADELREVLNKN